MVRILTTLERIIGKSSTGYTEAYRHAQEIKKSLDEFIPRDIPTNIYLATQWTNGMIDKSAGTYYAEKDFTDKMIFYYEKRHLAISHDVLENHLNAELRAFDINYKPIIKTLKSIKKTTSMLDSLTILDFLFINALK